MRTRAAAGVAATFALTMSTAHVRAEDTQKDTQKVCQDIKTVNSAIRNLENLNDDSTVAEARMAEERLDNAISNLAKGAKKARPEQYKELKSAHQEYEKALMNVPDDATLGQAQGKLQASQARLDEAYQSMKQSLNCSESLEYDPSE